MKLSKKPGRSVCLGRRTPKYRARITGRVYSRSDRGDCKLQIKEELTVRQKGESQGGVSWTVRELWEKVISCVLPGADGVSAGVPLRFWASHLKIT